MSYVDAIYDKDKDLVRIAERVDGKRILVDHRPEYTFYVADGSGTKRSIHGDRVSEVRCRSHKEFKIAVGQNKHQKLFESDVKPLNKTIALHYQNAEAPVLNNAFFDIETAFQKFKAPDNKMVKIRKKKR